jgi:hypothetical protein
MPKQRPQTSFSGDELARLLHVLERSDSVELKLTVPESDHRSAVAALGLDPLQAQIRQVVFFDTPDLLLDRNGVVVRARRIQGKPADSVVKLRPVDPAELPPETRALPGLKVEVDALPGGFVCSASLKGAADDGDVRAAGRGDRSPRKLFTKEQQRFFDAFAPDGISLRELAPLGPITLLKLPFSVEGFSRKLVAELWFYPDGTRILELSARSGTGDAFETAAELRGFLATRGVELTGDQQTKTRKALDHFARTLRAGTAAGA